MPPTRRFSMHGSKWALIRCERWIEKEAHLHAVSVSVRRLGGRFSAVSLVTAWAEKDEQLDRFMAAVKAGRVVTYR